MQDEDDAMAAIIGASIKYRLAFGPNAGRKALTLQTVPVRTEQRKAADFVTQQAGILILKTVDPGKSSQVRYVRSADLAAAESACINL